MRRCIILPFLLLAACESATEPEDRVGPPAAVLNVVGNDQTARVGTTLAVDLRAVVVDTAKRPVSQVPITWAGDGEAFAVTTVTNLDGSITNSWTLGTRAGRQTLQARWVDPVTGTPEVLATWTATATPGPVASFSFADTAYFSTPYEAPLDFSMHAAMDAHGNTVGSWILVVQSGPAGVQGKALTQAGGLGIGSVGVVGEGDSEGATFSYAVCLTPQLKLQHMVAWAGGQDKVPGRCGGGWGG